MIRGTCHCGEVQFALDASPEWLTRCNCSMCRRIGGLWAHAPASAIEITCPDGGLEKYIWGDKTLAFVSCKRCGCTTHWESLEQSDEPRGAVNCSMADPSEIAEIRVRNFDGADSWRYVD